MTKVYRIHFILDRAARFLNKEHSLTPAIWTMGIAGVREQRREPSFGSSPSIALWLHMYKKWEPVREESNTKGGRGGVALWLHMYKKWEPVREQWRGRRGQNKKEREGTVARRAAEEPKEQYNIKHSLEWHVPVLFPISGKKLATDLGKQYYHYRLAN